MAGEDELVIELEGDEGGVRQVEIEGDKTRKTDDDPVAGFKKQLETAQAELATAKQRGDDEARRRTEAEAEAERLRGAEAKARTETVDSQIDAVANAITAAQTESEKAEADYASAMEAGDFKAAAKAQRAMSTAEAKLVRLGDAKIDLEEAKKTPPKTEVRRDPPKNENPVEAFIATRTSATQAWLRQHQDVAESLVRGGDLGQITIGADAEAKRRGIAPDTDAYFHLIEERLGLREARKPEQDHEDPPQRRKPMASAPASREVSAGHGGSNGQKVTLTKGEQASATDGTLTWTKHDKAVREGKAVAGQPIGLAEMARRKHAMKQQGYYDRAAVE